MKPILINISADYLAFSRELPGPLNFVGLYRHARLEGWTLRPHLRLTAKYKNLSWLSSSWLNQDNTIYDNTRSELSATRMKYLQILWNYGLRQSFTYAQNNLLAEVSAESSAYRYRYENILYSSFGAIDKTSPQSSVSANVQYQMQPGYFMLTNSVAMRYDHLQQDDHLSARYEAALRNWGDKYLEIGGTIGNSYAVPSPYDLYWKGDSQAMGNPDLRSENSFGYQIWLQGTLPQMQLKATLHRNKIENLIVWRQVQMNGTAWKPVNVGEAEIRNLELEGVVTPFKLVQMNASALFTQARDTSNANFSQAPKLMYRPEVIYALSATLHKGIWQLWSKLSYNGEQWTTPDNLIVPIAAYTLVDCGFSLHLKWQNWSISPNFSIKNLNDAAYMVHAYVPEPGRSYYAGITIGR